jgi:glycosyltransferase involved in cell wall biosynthesis
LLLSSVSEGLPRVTMEAFARGRPVVATRAGGIPDIVEHERNGLLVPSDDAEALADAIVAVLTDRDLAERLAAGAGDSAAAMSATAEEYATSMRTLVERVAGRP